MNKDFNFKIIYGYYNKTVFWIRFYHFNFGFVITKNKMLFSERMGIIKYIKLPFGYRMRFSNMRS